MSTYREAGVDLDAADALVGSIADDVTSTWGPRVVGSFGGFAGGFRLPAGYDDPVLMMSTDGIGTKLDLARRHARLDGIGFDLVAMVVDDLAAAGAEPLALTDYIAVGRLDVAEVASIVRSIAAACRHADVALIGGETAEHPGTMAPTALDVSATALGVAEGTALFDPGDIATGDIVVGISSPNIRSNGFSLVRSILDRSEIDIGSPMGSGSLLDIVLEPSVIYAPAAMASKAQVKAYVHVTGGGLPGNLNRVLPTQFDAVVDERRWQEPAVFDRIAEAGAVDRDEMRRVFNMGIGFVAICDPSAVDPVIARFAGFGHEAQAIGSIEPGTGLVRYEPSKGTAERPKS